MQRRHYAKTRNLGTCLLDTKDQLTIDRDTTFQNQSDIATALEALQNTTPKLPQEWVETISNQLATTIGTTRPGLAKDNITHVLSHQSHRRQSHKAICSPLQHLTLSFNLRPLQSQCSINCTCRCHASVASYRPWNTVPKMLQMIMGSMFFEYSSCPVSRTTCDFHPCSKSLLTRLTIRYGFPFWSFKYAIHILVDKLCASSLIFTIALRRKIPLEASGDNIIYQAAIGNLSAVKRIVFENPSAIMDVNYYGDSALSISIERLLPWELSLQICEVLLQAGADPDQLNERGLSFRHTMANLVLQNTIPFMLHSRVESLIKISTCLDDLDFTFIHEIVVKSCPIDLAPVLKTGKADIMAQIHSEDRFGMTPLMYAVALGDTKAAEALIEAGASVHKKGPYGRNLIDYVAYLPPSTCTALLDLLLTAGADATTVYPSGWTLLHTAALHDNVTMMDRLVHSGARPDCFGPRGNRPIHYAARQNSVKAVRLLYRKGVDLNVISKSGLSPLGVAIQNNAIDTQTLLLELGADYLVTGDWGTHFHLAADYGCEKTLETLSSFDLKGLDVDAIDAEGLTATDVFENRYDKTDELTKAFYQLKDSIKSKSSDGIQDENENGDIDEFFDAHEFLHYGESR